MVSRSALAVRLQALGLAVLFATVSSPAAVQAQAGTAQTRGAAIGRGVVVASHPAAIVGSAWNADNSPIPGARVRLRNVVTGQLVAATLADQAGQFTFADVPPGSYIVELVSETGKILAVGHPLTANGGETVATFVRLGSKSPWFSGFFGSAALAVATAAAATGLTAVAPEQVRSVSARQ